MGNLVLKDDTCLPSASLKDRASAVAVARARQLGIDHLACASTGNAAASLAVLTARAGMTCTIFVPASALGDYEAKDITGRQFVISGNRVWLLYPAAFPVADKDASERPWTPQEIGDRIRKSMTDWPEPATVAKLLF